MALHQRPWQRWLNFLRIGVARLRYLQLKVPINFLSCSKPVRCYPWPLAVDARDSVNLKP
jgi:hypothetical protein